MIATKQSAFSLIALLLVAATGYCQDCAVMKKGKFKYVDNATAWFVIKGNQHTEYLNNGKHYIQSTIKWTSDCAYIATVDKCTVPDFPVQPGDTMTVTITGVKDGVIYFSTELKGEKMEGKVTKDN